MSTEKNLRFFVKPSKTEANLNEKVKKISSPQHDSIPISNILKLYPADKRMVSARLELNATRISLR